MPPLQTLTKGKWSTTVKLGVLSLRAYLLIATLLLLVKLAQVAWG